MNLHLLLDLDELIHHVLVDVEPSGRIQDDHVEAVLRRVLQRRLRDVHRLVPGAHAEHGNALLVSIDLKLLDGRRPVDVAGRKERFLPLGLKLSCQLGGGRGLTCTLETCHHDDGDLPAGLQLDFRGLGAHQIHELLVYDFYDHLSRRQAV